MICSILSETCGTTAKAIRRSHASSDGRQTHNRSDTAEQLTPDSRPTDERQTPDLDAMAERITATVTAAVTLTMKADNELAEKYAHAAHRIGELESEVRHLTEDRTRLLTDGQAEADRLRKHAADLESELRAERSRSWWQKLLGK